MQLKSINQQVVAIFGASRAKHAIGGFLEVLRVELMHEKISVSVTNIMRRCRMRV